MSEYLQCIDNAVQTVDFLTWNFLEWQYRIMFTFQNAYSLYFSLNTWWDSVNKDKVLHLNTYWSLPAVFVVCVWFDCGVWPCSWWVHVVLSWCVHVLWLWCVCVRERVWEWDWETVYMCVRESERECGRECMCYINFVCVWVRACCYINLCVRVRVCVCVVAASTTALICCVLCVRAATTLILRVCVCVCTCNWIHFVWCWFDVHCGCVRETECSYINFVCVVILHEFFVRCEFAFPMCCVFCCVVSPKSLLC